MLGSPAVRERLVSSTFVQVRTKVNEYLIIMSGKSICNKYCVKTNAMAREHGKQRTPERSVDDVTPFHQSVLLVLGSSRRSSDGCRVSDRPGRTRRRVRSDSDAGTGDMSPLRHD